VRCEIEIVGKILKNIYIYIYIYIYMCVCERNNKKKTWEENFGGDSRRKKDVEKKFRKIAL
jgi:hypothetical protein